ncbi:hypothetical protein pipiens_000135, partial [Culex pipiens pipiens]
SACGRIRPCSGGSAGACYAAGGAGSGRGRCDEGTGEGRAGGQERRKPLD